MLHKISLLAAGAMFGFAAISLTGGAASAAGMPLSSPAATQSTVVDGIIQVAERRNDRRMRSSWDMKRDGRRCSKRLGNCRHYHRGHYYETPWWTLPLIIGGSIAVNNAYDGDGYGNRHVEWCLDRYRSYNPRNNTWVAYSGNVNQCNSPYG
jgi:hypothetical protein